MFVWHNVVVWRSGGNVVRRCSGGGVVVEEQVLLLAVTCLQSLEDQCYADIPVKKFWDESSGITPS